MTFGNIMEGLKVFASFGYPVLFIGLVLEFLGIPFPGEIVLTFTGFLVWNGHLKFGVAVFAAVLGSVAGTIAAYFMGQRFGRPLLDKYGKYVLIDKKKIDLAERWFNRHSSLVLLFGRFIPGIRPLSAYTAGIARMNFRLFLPLSIIGSLMWCTTFISIGKHLGKNWQRVSVLLEKYDILLLVLALAGILAFWGRKVLFRRKP